MTIERLVEATQSALEDINRVNGQLHEGRVGTIEDLQALLANENNTMIVAKDGDKIIGIATLYVFPKIGKRGAYIEDVVVDSAYRGQGLGEKIVREIIAVAREKKADSVYLTSRPVHAAAHKLYQKVGFDTKDTTVFTMKL